MLFELLEAGQCIFNVIDVQRSQSTFIFVGTRISPSCQQALRGGGRPSHHVSRPEHTVSDALWFIWLFSTST